MIERADFAPDSAGSGRHRGGPGIDFAVSARADMEVTIVNERSHFAPFALMGGEKGRPTVAYVRRRAGDPEEHMKVTGLALPKGGVVEILSSGGGGYGDPAERPAEAVRADVAAGYMTETVARERYPHAFEG